MSRGLAHEHWLPLLGLPLAVRTNSRTLSEALDYECPLGAWERLPPELIEPIPTLEIDVLLSDGEGRAGGTRLFRHGPLALAGGAPPLLMADAGRGYGLACLPPEPAGAALGAIWDLGQLLAQARGRVFVRAAALALGRRAVLLAGEDMGALLAACAARGLRLLARDVAHLSEGAGGLLVWGDGAGGDLLCCPGPAAICLVERVAGRSSRLAPIPLGELGELGAAPALGAAYRLWAGGDPAMAAALVDHVLGAGY